MLVRHSQVIIPPSRSSNEVVVSGVRGVWGIGYLYDLERGRVEGGGVQAGGVQDDFPPWLLTVFCHVII